MGKKEIKFHKGWIKVFKWRNTKEPTLPFVEIDVRINKFVTHDDLPEILNALQQNFSLDEPAIVIIAGKIPAYVFCAIAFMLNSAKAILIYDKPEDKAVVVFSRIEQYKIGDGIKI